LSRSTRRARPGPESSTAGGGSRASTKPRGRRRPMTRQLVSRPVEGEAAIDRPASLVHAVARCHSGGSAPGFSQRLCQMFWQNQAGTRPGVRTDWRGTSQRPHLRPAETAALPWTSRFGRSRGGRQRGSGSWRLPSAACTCAVGELANVRNSELAKCGNLDRATTRASHAPRPQGAPQPAQEIAGSPVR
jgi:hypothetical protein